MPDDEILHMYIEESREHLVTIENDLLAMEAGGADIDEDLVNKVFRAAHSLKGGAGFFNLIRIKELAHGIENVLGLVRSRELVPNPEVINILLLSFDRLRELINQVDGSNEADISDFLMSLKGLTTSYLAPEQKGALDQSVEIQLSNGNPFFRVTAFDLLQARKGNILYGLDYDLLHDIQQKGKNPLDLIRRLTEIGMIVDSRIDLSVVGDLDAEPTNRIPYLVFFASIIEPDLISDLLELEPDRIQVLGDDPRLIPLSSYQAGPVSVPTAEVITPRPVAKPDSTPVKIPEAPATVQPPKTSAEAGGPVETSLRVQVHLLESLMNLAGELVLSRNQLLQAIGQQDSRAVQASGQKISLVTSELQEIIMLTRMQPIGNIFNKFQRVVRDLAQTLGKDIALKMSGNEVELDKTLIEGLGDPLTHLVRNAVDHGIEGTEERRSAGKNPRGSIQLKAYHEAGQVHIEISDDGRGLDPEKIAAAAVAKNLITVEQGRALSDREKRALIFLPGFSLAKEVTYISGRGVGMDVVKTNLDRLGGQVDIESVPGQQTIIHIKLPLTLAIIPCLFVSVNGERFAVPQVNVEELIYIPADQVKKRIELVGEREVLVLRGKLIPIVELGNLLGIPSTFPHPVDGERRPDTRRSVADRRSRKNPLWEPEGEASKTSEGSGDPGQERRDVPERRRSYRSDLNIVVASQGSFQYGLVVEEMHDSVEIVVKPLGRHLKHLREYAGATIMGDGRVAPILDINGLSTLAGMSSLTGSGRARELEEEERRERFQDVQALLLFRNHPEEPCAVPLEWVERVEQVSRYRIETLGHRKVLQYRGGSLPLFSLSEAVNLKELPPSEELIVIVFRSGDREAGLLAHAPVDAFEGKINFDRSTLKQKGIMGSAIIQGQTTLIVEIPEIIETLFPEWAETQEEERGPQASAATLLLAEDSDFFRAQVKKYLEEGGFQVLAGENGLRAWNLLEEAGEKIKLVVTDIEMPELDGYGLTRRIKSDPRFSHLPVVALTSLAGEEDIARGKDAGVDDYQIKLDRDNLLESVRGLLA
jgi:two-component system, chemotaxis family, sensor kinase CheA